MVIVVLEIKKINKEINTGKIYYNKDSSFIYVKNYKEHRYYGFAALVNNFKCWMFNGVFYGKKCNIINCNCTKNFSQKQFMKDLNKKWLL